MFTSVHTQCTSTLPESNTFRSKIWERLFLHRIYSIINLWHTRIYEHNIVYRKDFRRVQQLLLIQAFSCRVLNWKKIMNDNYLELFEITAFKAHFVPFLSRCLNFFGCINWLITFRTTYDLDSERHCSWSTVVVWDKWKRLRRINRNIRQIYSMYSDESHIYIYI